MCENIDWNVGRVLAKLDELKLAENTIVVYFSDNGPNGWRWNGGMKGRKGSTDEGGIRSPLLIRWPGQIKPGTKVTQIAGAIDLLPTLADLAGVQVAGDQAAGRPQPEAAAWPARRRPGRDRIAVHALERPAEPADAAVSARRRRRAVRHGRRPRPEARHRQGEARRRRAACRLRRRSGAGAVAGRGKGRAALHRRLCRVHAAAGPRRRAARQRQAQRRRAELLVLHQLDEHRRPHHLGRRGRHRPGGTRRACITPAPRPTSARRSSCRFGERQAADEGDASRTTRRCMARSTTACRGAASRT